MQMKSYVCYLAAACLTQKSFALQVQEGWSEGQNICFKGQKEVQETYCTKKKLGEGAFGVVGKVVKKKTGKIASIVGQSLAPPYSTTTYAMKVLKVSDKPGLLGFSPIDVEINILKHLKHDNIIKLHDFKKNVDGNDYVILEYFEGIELYQFLKNKRKLHPIALLEKQNYKKNNPTRALLKAKLANKEVHEHSMLTEKEVVKIFGQILDALKYMHGMSITHRDLKPENIMINPKTLKVKIIDFGLSTTTGGVHMLTHDAPLAGSLPYFAPECLAFHQENLVWRSFCVDGLLSIACGKQLCSGSAVDMFAAGLILRGLIDNNSWELITDETNGDYINDTMFNKRHILKNDFFQKASDLFRHLVKDDPKKRFSAQQALDSPFMKQSVWSLIKKGHFKDALRHVGNALRWEL